MYSVEIEEIAEKFLKKLNQKDRNIILKKFYSIRQNPLRFLKRLQGKKLWRLRISKYRVLVDVVISGRRIVVLKIGYRKNIY